MIGGGRNRRGELGYDGLLSFEWEKRWAPDIEPPERAFPQFAYEARATWEGV